MLEILKNLFAKKTPEGVIPLNDLHFIACSNGNNLNTITWDSIKKEIKVFHINNEAMKQIYGRCAYDLSQYGYLEVYNNHQDTPYIKLKIEHKNGQITGLQSTEEHPETTLNVVVLEG